MNGLRIAVAALAAASCLPAAFGDQPYYEHGAHVAHYPAAVYAGYSTGYAGGCYSCGGGYGYGMGVPGCCDRPISKADHLWDGYCAEKNHGWFSNRCDTGCDSCCQQGVGGLLFSLKRHRCSSCTSCNSSCTSGCGAPSSCTAGNAIAAPAHNLDSPPAPPASEPPQPPQPPLTDRSL